MDPELDQGNSSGRPSLDASQIAADAAAQVVRTEPDPQATPAEPEPQGLPSPGERFVEGQPHQLEGEPEPEPEPQATEPEPEPEPQPTPTAPEITVEDLDAAGVVLPIQPEDVPDEFKPVYNQLAQTVIDAKETERDVVSDAKRALAHVQDFSERLKTPEGQERMLLTMAMSEGGIDTFQKVVDQIERMQEDPQYAEAVRRQLETEVQLETVRRREAALNQRERTSKAQRIVSRTRRVADQLGIDRDWAEQEVANAILRNEASTGQKDITIEQVDQTLRNLAERAGARPARPKPPVKSPETQRAEGQASQAQAQGTGQTPSQEEPPAPSPDRRDVPSPDNALDDLRNAIKSSGRRLRNQGLTQ